MLSDASQPRSYFRSIAPWVTLATVASIALGAGCRGSKPFARMVRVTQQPETELPNIDAPNQRLITGNAQSGSVAAPTSTDDPLSPDNPSGVELASNEQDRFGKLTARNDVAKNRRVAEWKEPEPSSNDPASSAVPEPSAAAQDAPLVRSVAADITPTDSPDSNRRNRQTTAQTVSAKIPAEKRTASSRRRLSQADYDRIMEAFEDYPPEVRREAMRRLTAAMAANAPQTDQPGSLSESLRSQMADLPQLPESNGTPNRRPLRRPGFPDQPANAAELIAKTNLAAQPSPKSTAPLPPKSTAPLPPAPPEPQRTAATSAPGSAPSSSTASSSPTPSSSTATTASLSDLLGGNNSPVTTSRSPSPAVTEAPLVRTANIDSPTDSSPGASFAAGTAAASAPTNAPTVAAASATIGNPAPSLPSTAMESLVENPPTSILEVDGAPASTTVDDLDASAQLIKSIPPTNPSAATPGDADPTTLDSQALFQALVKQLSTAPEGETEAQRSARLIKLRHLMVLSGNPDGAVEKIDGMSDTEQEYLRHQLMGLWTMVDPDGHPVHQRRLSHAIDDFRQATRHAAAATDSLEVRSLAFCTEIVSYGQIKRFEGNRFTPGQPVILYCEIDNFTAKKLDEGYLTHLQGSYDIYDAENHKVTSQLLPTDKQTSANYLRDYFIAYQIHMPDDLPEGTYRMQLTMEDANAKKYGQASIPLEITK